MKFRRDRLFWYVILGLVIIGIISMLRHLLVPVLVLGAIFLLYKFPPNRWGISSERRSASAKQRRAKRAKFHVIDGTKRNDDDDTPRYH